MKWNLLGAAGLVICMFPAAVTAAPVYLECVMSTGQKDVLWNVTLDEATSSVAYTIPEMNVAKKLPGIFSPDKVLFDTMSISRVDLSFVRSFNIAGISRTDVGQCKIPTTPARKF